MSKAKELQPWKSEFFHVDMKLRGIVLHNVIYALNRLIHQLNPDRLPVDSPLAAEIKGLESVVARLDKIIEGEG
jgi:hypothetical protein